MQVEMPAKIRLTFESPREKRDAFLDGMSERRTGGREPDAVIEGNDLDP
jgi:hypothetical protein